MTLEPVFQLITEKVNNFLFPSFNQWMQHFLGDGMDKSLCDVTFSPARGLFHFQCWFGFGLTGNVKGAAKKKASDIKSNGK